MPYKIYIQLNNIIKKGCSKLAVFLTINQKGKYHDANAKQDVSNYILDREKMISGYKGFMGVDPEEPALSMEKVSAFYGKSNGVQLRHFSVSFAKDEISDPAIVNAIANELMMYIGQDYQVLYGVHEDKADHLHFHMAFNTVNYTTGERYRGNKTEYYNLLNETKRIARKYGVYKIYPMYKNSENIF